MDAPTGLMAEHVPCGVRGNVKLTYAAPTYAGGASSHLLPKYRVVLELLNDPAMSGEREFIGTGTVRFVRVPDGKTYRAKEAQTCLPRNGDVCGLVSTATVDVTIPDEICIPRGFDGVAGDGMVTLRWNFEDDAEGYEVEQEGVAIPFTTRDEYLVISGLTNGTTYNFRVRATGSLGTTDWSYWRALTPTSSASDTPSAVGEVVDASNEAFFGQHDAALSWSPAADAALYDVRVWDGTVVRGEMRGDWRVMPVRPKGWGERYEAEFDYSDIKVGVGLSGLIPGTDYAFYVRGVNGSARSKWSDRVLVEVPGTVPANAPSLAPIPPPKMPPSSLMAAVDETTVNLSWTAATNSNYTSQRLLRRVAGVSPIDWTEISVGVDDTTYMDTGLTSGTTYRYRVQGCKDNGNCGQQKGGFADAVIP